MDEPRAERTLRRFGQLQANRSNFESLWQQVAERALPGSAQFTTRQMPGVQQTEKMFDATAALAVRKFATILESMLTPRTQQWHKLKAADDELGKLKPVSTYLEEVNRLLFRERYAPTSNFSGQVGACYLDLAAFANASMLVDETPGYGLRYRALPLAETYFAENHVGMVDTIYRKFEYTARQAVQRWGEKCPPKIHEVVERTPDQAFTFVHAIEPHDGQPIPGVLREHRYLSTYVCESEKAVVQVGGYYTFPAPIMRDLTSPGETYGRGPGVLVLPDVKMLNEMNKTVIRAAHKAVDPPLLLSEDGALSAFDQRPGALNHGGLGPNGEQLVQAMDSKARVDIGLEMMQAKQQTINEAFFITLFQILVDNPRMTATEVLERAQEKGMLLGPLAGRQMSEFLGPMVERELDLLARAGRLPPMPDELLEVGGEYKIEYESPLARAQRAEEGVAIVRTLETLLPMAEMQPEVFDNFDLDETVRALGEINGMAAKLMRDPEDVAAMREARAQAQQAAQMAEMVPGLAKGAKDVASIVQGAA